MKVFAFDRDYTVDVSLGPVPLEWIRKLAHETEHEVRATGNQALRDEADIPGDEELTRRLGLDGGLTTRDKRIRRLELLPELFPEAEEYIVVDDIDLSRFEPTWTYYHPDEFVSSYEEELGDR